MQVVRRLSVLVVCGAFAIAGCGDSSGPGSPSSVALLTHTSFVEYDTADYAAESSELEFTIRSYGIAVAPIAAYDSTTIAGLSQHAAFVVPEQEVGNSLVDSLGAGALTVLRRFVDSGGGALVVVPDDAGRALIDTLFGYALDRWFNASNYQLVTGNSNGTAFAGGPSQIWDNDGTYALDPTTLPPGARIIYQAANGAVAVGVIPQGRGAIILLGWDWYNAEPHGSQDGGWIEAFRRALHY